jgi:hypothetical protein
MADTIPFNPADMAYPLAFNPLAQAPGIPAHLQAAGLFARLLPFPYLTTEQALGNQTFYGEMLPM